MSAAALKRYGKKDSDQPQRSQRLSACHPGCPQDCQWARLDERGTRRCRVYMAPSQGTVIWTGRCYFYGLEPLPQLEQGGLPGNERTGLNEGHTDQSTRSAEVVEMPLAGPVLEAANE